MIKTESNIIDGYKTLKLEDELSKTSEDAEIIAKRLMDKYNKQISFNIPDYSYNINEKGKW